MRRTALGAVKGVVSVGLLVYVLRQVDISDLGSSLARGNPWFLTVGALSQLMGLLLSAARWHILIRIQAVMVPFRRTVLIYWIGTFFNALLPSSVGGDVVKGYLMARQRGQAIEVATTVIAERLVGLLALAILAAGGSIWLLAGAGPAAGALAALALVGRPRFPGPGFAPSLPPGLAEPMARTARSLRRYADRWPELVPVFGLSLALQMNVIVYYFVVARALGIDVSLAHLCVLIPPVLVLSMLPVSLGGLGVREAAFVALFAPLGFAPAQLVALSLWSHALAVLISLGGGVVYALSPTSPATKSRKEES